MPFDKLAHISMQQNAVSKFIKTLNKEGISFIPEDTNRLENVAFLQGDKTIRMSQHSFYRYSGMIYYKRGTGDEKDNRIILTPVTDEMWLNDVIHPIVLERLKQE